MITDVLGIRNFPPYRDEIFEGDARRSNNNNRLCVADVKPARITRTERMLGGYTTRQPLDI